jgi:hypothetical protein
MNEDLLQFIWNIGLYDSTNLKTGEGEDLQVISPGIRNSDSGPDFYNARIRIGDTLWVGTVEVHQKASEWNRHGHQHDRAYDNVILHVVEKNDMVIRRKNGEIIPCLEISCPENSRKRYLELSKSKQEIPCGNRLATVDRFKIQFWLNRIAIGRLEHKTDTVNALLNATYNDLEEVFHCLFFRYFGVKINAIPFEMLSRSLPAKLIRKYSHSLQSIEALLFGQAGLLNFDATDSYAGNLQTEYRFLKNKHELVELDTSIWKYTRLRPASFPTVRIAQLAAILHRHHCLWDTVVNLASPKEIYATFDAAASEYWDNHYVFGKTSAKTSVKRLGKTAIDTLTINVLIPMILSYSIHRNNRALTERVMDMLESLPPESNSTVSEWIQSGYQPVNALESQALLQLHSEYCNHRKCLKCAIGKEIIQNIINTET